jgi:hypothetical protein
VLLEVAKRKVNISTSQRESHQRRPSEDVIHIVTKWDGEMHWTAQGERQSGVFITTVIYLNQMFDTHLERDDAESGIYKSW